MGAGISTQLVYLEDNHRNNSEEAENSEKGRNRIEEPHGGSGQLNALGLAMHWVWLCTRRSCQAFIGAYEEQCRVTKTALCVKCLLSKHKDLICDPQNPSGSWAWLAAPATPALELWAESGSSRASLGDSLGKTGIFKFSETSCLKTISWRSNQRKILKLTSGLHMCPTGDNTHSASHENNVEHTLLFLSRKQGG